MKKFTYSFFVVLISMLVYFWLRRSVKSYFNLKSQTSAQNNERGKSKQNDIYSMLKITEDTFVYEQVPVEEQVPMKIKIIQPKNSLNLPILIFYHDTSSKTNDSNDYNYDDFLAKFSLYGNIVVYKWEFSSESFLEQKEKAIFYNFCNWAIEYCFSSTDTKCNWNQIYLGGNEYGSFISFFFALKMKNNFKYSPKYLGQFLFQPKFFNFNKHKDNPFPKILRPYVIFDSFLNDEDREYKLFSFKDPYLFLKTIIITDEKVNENNKKKTQKVVDYMHEDKVDVTHIDLGLNNLDEFFTRLDLFNVLHEGLDE